LTIRKIDSTKKLNKKIKNLKHDKDKFIFNINSNKIIIPTKGIDSLALIQDKKDQSTLV